MDGSPHPGPARPWADGTEGRLAALETEVRHLAGRVDRLARRVEVIFWVVLGTSGASLPAIVKGVVTGGLP